MAVKIQKHGAKLTTMSTDKLQAAIASKPRRRKHIIAELAKRGVTVE